MWSKQQKVQHLHYITNTSDSLKRNGNVHKWLSKKNHKIYMIGAQLELLHKIVVLNLITCF